MDFSAHCIPSPTCSFSRCKQVLSNNYHILILSRVYTQLLPPDSSSTFVHSFRLFLPLLGIRPVCSHTCSFRSQNRHTDSSFLPHFVLLSSPLGLMVVQLVSIGSHHFWLLPVGRHESLMISMGVWQFSMEDAGKCVVKALWRKRVDVRVRRCYTLQQGVKYASRQALAEHHQQHRVVRASMTDISKRMSSRSR